MSQPFHIGGYLGLITVVTKGHLRLQLRLSNVINV